MLDFAKFSTSALTFDISAHEGLVRVVRHTKGTIRYQVFDPSSKRDRSGVELKKISINI